MVLRSILVCLFFVILLLSSLGYADTAAFDLPGPRVEVRVSRAGKELPIAEVPNLQEDDRLWIHPAFPETQSAHYLLIVAFLRGITNPPPENWFTKIETWNKHVRDEGTMVSSAEGRRAGSTFPGARNWRRLRHAAQGMYAASQEHSCAPRRT